MREAGGGDVEDLEAVVGRVDREQPAAVGREGQRPDLPALEGDELCHGRNGNHEREQQGDGKGETAGRDQHHR